MTAVLLAGVVGLAGGGVLAAGARSFAAGLWAQAAGVALVGAAGAWAFLGGNTAGSDFAGALRPHVGIDPLTGLFLATLGVVAVPALVFATAYLAPTAGGRITGALLAGFTLSLVGVLCSRDPLTFLTFWELMTLVPAAIILVGRSDEPARRTAFTYVGITHLGGAGVWVAILLLAHEGVLGDEGALERGSGVQAAIAIAALIGFGTKAGAMPFHAWLPRAHPIAPAPVSALMSGVMVKVALYGLVRVLWEWLGEPPGWVGAAVLALGALSAVGGIVYALFAQDLKRLLAFSTIDNVGIALLALGASLLFRSRGEDAWAALALGAALLHVVNHAACKGLLFLGAGSLERAVGSLDLDGLGGLLRRMPWTGGALLVGCAAIAGLPTLNGFASEWLTAQSLLHVPALGATWDGALGALALTALAAAAALAAYCFVKVVGTALLGPTSRAACANAVEAPRAMRAAVVSLAAACVALGLAPGLLYPRLVELAPGAALPTHVGLELPGTGGLPTFGLALVLAGLAGAVLLARGSRRAEPSPTWACGQPSVPELRWTGAGFTKSLRLVLEAALRPEREITVETNRGVVTGASYTGRVPHHLDERVYRPVTRGALRAAAHARRLQSGRLGTYVAYLVLLVLALLLGVRSEVIG